MSAALIAPWLRRLPPWLPCLAFTALFLALAAPHWLDPATVLDDTRQFGPPLLWPEGAPPVGVTQLAYFAAGTPPLFRLLAQALIEALGWPVAAVLKLLAVLLAVPTSLGLWLLADGLVVGAPAGRVRADPALRKAGLALFLVGNVLVSTQVLSGTPRDLGTLLLLFALVALLKRRWGIVLLLLVPLAGVYPTYGLLLVTTLLISLVFGGIRGVEASSHPGRWQRCSTRGGLWRRLALALAAVAVAAIGLRWGGPTLTASEWGPTLRLFVGTQAQNQPPWNAILAEAARGGGLGPVSLLGVPPLELIATDRFRPLPGAKHLLPWVGSLALLLLGGLVAGARCWQQRRRAGAQERPFEALWPWRWRVFVSLLLAGVLLYGLAFVLAFALHNPVRFADLPARLLLSLAELVLLEPLLAWPAVRSWVLPGLVGLALVLALPVRPPGLVTVPLEAIRSLQERLAIAAHGVAPSKLLVLNPQGEPRLEALNNSLALLTDATSFQAEELDRGFHLGAIRRNVQLRRDRRWFERQPLQGAADLPHPWLKARGITHLLLVRPRSQLLRWTPACRTAIPWSRRGRAQLLLVDLACERRHTPEVSR